MTTLDVGRIMKEVRAALAGRRSDVVLANNSDRGGELPALWNGVRSLSEQKATYCLAELLAFSDREFIENSYRVVLRRAPDPEGLSHYLGRLRDRSISKVEALGELRWSSEGVSRGIHIDGLLLPYRLQQLKRRRYIGPLVAWLHGVARLGSAAHRLDALEAHLSHALDELGRHVNRSNLQLSARTSETRSAVEAAQAGIEQVAVQVDGIDAVVVRARADVDHLVEVQRRAAVAHDQTDARVEALGQLLDMLARSALAGADDIGNFKQRVAGELEALAERVDLVTHSAKSGVDRIDTLSQHVAGLEARMAPASELQALSERLDILAGSAKLGMDALEGLREHLAGLEAQMAPANELQALSERLDGLTGSAKLGMDALDDLREHLAGLEAGMAADLESRLVALERVRDARAQVENSLDPLYVAFERQFRGAPELIEARVESYLEVLREAKVGGLEQPVLDVGSGNGEWLDVLRRHGFSGRGVDSNRMFVDLCRGRGLDVAHGDALEYLRSLPDGSVGAITAMHVAEHLPFEILIQLLDQAHRVLCVGGVIALETPNPENVLVGSHYFYMDPTHRNPIPPEALRWLVEARGFQRTRIERLTVAREIAMPQLLPGDDAETAAVNAMLGHFRAALDYSVIGRRL